MLTTIVVMVLAAHVATFPHFFELVQALLSLAAVLTVPLDRLVQILFRPMYIVSTPVVLVGVSRNRSTGD